VAAEMDLEGRSLKAQMTLADRFGALYTVILGDRELETGEAQLRRMADGEQERVALKDLTTILAARAGESA
jgi:histidyl-tRNA synthetase